MLLKLSPYQIYVPHPFLVLPHSAYSLDAAPWDYHLFHSMQHGLKGQRFRNVNKASDWIDNFFRPKEPLFWWREIQLLPEECQKIVETEGNYFD